MTLDSAVADEARAVTSFDASGYGLVAVELDGQVVQLLATLTAAERNAAHKVRAGDRLRIEAVDTARNRCTVTYLGA
jgi:translation initiation factor IF-1